MLGASQSKVGSKAKHKEKPIKHKKPRQAMKGRTWNCKAEDNIKQVLSLLISCDVSIPFVTYPATSLLYLAFLQL